MQSFQKCMMPALPVTYPLIQPETEKDRVARRAVMTMLHGQKWIFGVMTLSRATEGTQQT